MATLYKSCDSVFMAVFSQELKQRQNANLAGVTLLTLKNRRGPN